LGAGFFRSGVKSKQAKGYWALVSYSSDNLDLEKTTALNKKMKKIRQKKKENEQQKTKRETKHDDDLYESVADDVDDDTDEKRQHDVNTVAVPKTRPPHNKKQKRRDIQISKDNDENTSYSLRLKEDTFENIFNKRKKQQTLVSLLTEESSGPTPSSDKNNVSNTANNNNNNNNNQENEFSNGGVANCNFVQIPQAQTVNKRPNRTQENLQVFKLLNFQTNSEQLVEPTNYSSALFSTSQAKGQQSLQRVPKRQQKYSPEGLRKIYWKLNDSDFVEKQRTPATFPSPTNAEIGMSLAPTQSRQRVRERIDCNPSDELQYSELKESQLTLTQAQAPPSPSPSPSPSPPPPPPPPPQGTDYRDVTMENQILSQREVKRQITLPSRVEQQTNSEEKTWTYEEQEILSQREKRLLMEERQFALRKLKWEKQKFKEFQGLELQKEILSKKERELNEREQQLSVVSTHNNPQYASSPQTSELSPVPLSQPFKPKK